MCRLALVLSSEPTSFAYELLDAPRSLASLSREHADGWGVAVFGPDTGTRIDRGLLPAASDTRYDRVARSAVGTMLIGHVRQRTVGALSVDNAHPFVSGEWCFAHNGTIAEPERLAQWIPDEYLARRRGQTDSELLFLYLLSRVERERDFCDVARSVAHAVQALWEIPELGATNFVLSRRDFGFAHRLGRTLYVETTHASAQGGRARFMSEPSSLDNAVPLQDGELWLVRMQQRAAMPELVRRREAAPLRPDVGSG